MPAVDDMRNYDLDGGVPMPPIDPSIAADPNNYKVELEPASPVVPLEQQASSSRTTLDDPPPVASEPAPHFLGFRLCPVEEISAAVRPTFVDEIVQWAIEGEEDETRVESMLLFMSAIFKIFAKRPGNEKWKEMMGMGITCPTGSYRATPLEITGSFLAPFPRVLCPTGSGAGAEPLLVRRGCFEIYQFRDLRNFTERSGRVSMDPGW
ncbi:hypothetical protein K438DRAFT_1995041 [Mycena galopus ATCC 62051]|nr:hypothetical protein K438DRAFT_1995041 [Mycena galopus ATCC 62051]